MRTPKVRGPMASLSWCWISRSPVTRSSLTKVPLVLSKSRTKTLPLRMSKAQCRLLMIGLAGLRLHLGSLPMTNCACGTGISWPSDFPDVRTTRLSFITWPLTLEQETLRAQVRFCAVHWPNTSREVHLALFVVPPAPVGKNPGPLGERGPLSSELIGGVATQNDRNFMKRI